jgi:hypothetical protein
MANSNVSSPSTTDVYQALYLISHLTDQLIVNLDLLKSAKVLAPRVVAQEKEAAKELRAVVAASSTVNLQREEMQRASQHQKNRVRMQTSMARVRPR